MPETRERLLLRPRAVVFDFDGTLIDSEGPDGELLGRLLDREGLHLDGLEILRLFAGVSRSEVPRVLLERYGFEVSPGWIDAYRSGRDLLESKARVSEDALAFFGFLEKEGISRAIASNSRKVRLERMVRTVGIGRWIDGGLYHLDAARRQKPAPDLYLCALHGIGIEASEALAIEDSAVGVRAARSAGIPCIGFSGYNHLGPEAEAGLMEAGAVCLARSMEEIRKLIETSGRETYGNGN